jgi:putative DNA primase/helicase
MEAALEQRTYSASEIAYLLGGAKPEGKDWKCRCPAHSDKNPSLSLKDGDDGRLIAYCFAGCSWEEIARALERQGIPFNKGRTQQKKVFSFRSSGGDSRILEVGERIRKLPITARYDYTSENGEYLYSKYKLIKPDGEKTFSILPVNVPPVLYNLPEIKRARESNLPVFVCEGEKDADSVSALGLASTSAPHGAAKNEEPGKKWKDSYTEALSGLDVVLFADNDEPGIKFAQVVATKVKDSAASVKVVEFPELQPGGDVTDYLLNHSKEDLLARVKATPLFVMAQDVKEFELTEFGNGKRFAYYSNGRARYSSSLKEWLSFNGKVWKVDSVLSERLAKDVIGLISKESIFHPTEKQQRTFESFLNKSKKWNGILHTLNCARSEPELQIAAEDLDRPPSLSGRSLFNANNGTIDLRTGALSAHNKEDFLTKISPVDYIPGASAPRWQQFLREIFNGDEELIEWMQCFLGYVMTGEVCLRLFAVLYGSGRNGKSTLVETISRVLGEDYAKGIPTQSLYAKREEKETAPELTRLIGARFAYASEGKENEKLNTGIVKRFTGDEKMTARGLYSAPVDFLPQFTVLFSTNHKPKIDDTTNSIWDRTRLIPFNRRFADEEVDPSLRKKFLKESSGILNWLVEGAVKFYLQGMRLPDCSAITQATQDYRSDSDKVQSFLSERCELGREYRVQVITLHEAFKQWSQVEQGGTDISLPNFREKMKEKGYSTVAGGQRRKFFVGIRLREEEDATEELNI